jgi:DNA polymerase-3 subunit delta'
VQGFPEQEDAKRLLGAALAEGPAHAYLLYGPRGVGKRRAAFEFAAELLGDRERSQLEHHTHPDLYVLEPVGEMIRIDDVRAMRRDLHMRPFEADRRVYLVLGADSLNDDAADALLKDLEEPPAYAVIVLVADDLGPLPETIRSRCQLVAFRRLTEKAVREELLARAPGLDETEITALARVAAGRLDRAERLLDPTAAARRETLIEVARAVYRDPAFEPSEAAARILEGVRAAGEAAREREETRIGMYDLPQREAEQRVRRSQRGAEREELLFSIEELAAWYRDLVAAAVGAEQAVIHFDRLDALREDASRERLVGAEHAAEAVRDAWRALEEFNLNTPLALEALFVRLRRELAGPVSVA